MDRHRSKASASTRQEEGTAENPTRKSAPPSESASRIRAGFALAEQFRRIFATEQAPLAFDHATGYASCVGSVHQGLTRVPEESDMPRSHHLTRLGLAAVALAGALVVAGCEADQFALPPVGASNPIAPTPPVTPPAPAPTPATPIAYTQDIKPILGSDCVRCHPDMATYTGALGWVSLGAPVSPIVNATQPGGTMHQRLSCDRIAKAELIRSWVFDFDAQENR
jgi:hypothetical protein